MVSSSSSNEYSRPLVFQTFLASPVDTCKSFHLYLERFRSTYNLLKPISLCNSRQIVPQLFSLPALEAFPEATIRPFRKAPWLIPGSGIKHGIDLKRSNHRKESRNHVAKVLDGIQAIVRDLSPFPLRVLMQNDALVARFTDETFVTSPSIRTNRWLIAANQLFTATKRPNGNTFLLGSPYRSVSSALCIIYANRITKVLSFESDRRALPADLVPSIFIQIPWSSVFSWTIDTRKSLVVVTFRLLVTSLSAFPMVQPISKVHDVSSVFFAKS